MMLLKILYPTLAIVSFSRAHSWVEQMSLISDNGSYTGVYGYPRSYVFGSDIQMSVLRPPNGQGRVRINKSDLLCGENQAKPGQSDNYPKLLAMPGSHVAIRYLENGHVTRTASYVPAVLTQIGKPGSGGLVYTYATTNTSNPKLMDVLQWGPNDSLDKGRLLSINSYNDGRCYQISDSPLGQQRMVEFKNPVKGQPGTSHELWCETDFVVPSDAQVGDLTIYWVWQWPTLPNMDPNVAAGKDEIYTTCSDITITDSQSDIQNEIKSPPLPNQDPQPLAVSDYKVRAANVTLPSDKSFYGPNNPNGLISISSSAGSVASSSQPGAAAAAPASSASVPLPLSNSVSTTSSPAPAFATAAATSPSQVTVYITVTVSPLSSTSTTTSISNLSTSTAASSVASAIESAPNSLLALSIPNSPKGTAKSTITISANPEPPAAQSTLTPRVSVVKVYETSMVDVTIYVASTVSATPTSKVKRDRRHARAF